MQIKNPYYINFIWLSIIIFILGTILLSKCFCCGLYCFEFRPRIENILLGILSSAILLLFLEIINFLVDKKKYGFIEGHYYRKAIYQVNDQRLRGSQIPTNITESTERLYKRKELLETNGENYIDDSIYHEMIYQRCSEMKYEIRLKYEFHGIYSGTAEYFLHDSYEGPWRARDIKKIKAFITLNLNSANIMTGSGSYKYSNRDDFGKYDFQVDQENKNRIIVSYQNILPSGLAEGYEIWEKMVT